MMNHVATNTVNSGLLLVCGGSCAGGWEGKNFRPAYLHAVPACSVNSPKICVREYNALGKGNVSRHQSLAVNLFMQCRHRERGWLPPGIQAPAAFIRWRLLPTRWPSPTPNRWNHCCKGQHFPSFLIWCPRHPNSPPL